MTPRGKVVLAASIGAGLVISMTMTAILMMRVVRESRKGPSERDRKLLVTVHHLREMGFATPDPDCCGKFGTLPSYGTRLVNYTYNAKGPPALHLHSQAQVTNALGAMQAYRMNLITMRTAMRASGQQFVERPELLHYGDDHYAALIQNKNGETVGNLFAFRKGGISVTVLLVGLYLEDPSEVETLFAPVVETIEARRKK